MEVTGSVGTECDRIALVAVVVPNLVICPGVLQKLRFAPTACPSASFVPVHKAEGVGHLCVVGQRSWLLVCPSVPLGGPSLRFSGGTFMHNV